MWKLPKGKKIGIDLGTTNTLVFVAGVGIVLNEPTVVAIDRNTKTILAIGHEAKDMIGKNPSEIIIYRPMQDGAIADYNVTYAMLKYFLDKSLGKNTIFKPDVLVSVPAGITSTEKRAVIEATIKAGAKSAVIVKEAILAAIGVGVSINDAKGCMIIDSGGGTTDIAVISLGGIVASTSVKCGGNKLDQAIIDYIRRNYNVIIGDQSAEDVKKNIASAININPDHKGEVRGRDIIKGLPVTIPISTNELVKALDYDLKIIIKSIKNVLEQTPPELASDIIDNGIVLTGGTSGLSNFAQLIEQQTGIKVRVADDAIFAVVKGAGILLDHLNDYKRSIMTKK